MHLKRNNTQKFWPIPRKGTKYLAVPKHNKRKAIPLIIILRDILKIVENKKELKKVLNERAIKINQKEIKEVNYPLALFDVISIPTTKKNYRVTLSNTKKMILEEINEKEAGIKIFKILNKKILPKGVIQLNLMHGKNIISKEKTNIGDSIVLNLKDNKIVKTIPLEKDKNVFVMEGKHAGIHGKIENIIERGDKKLAKIISNKEKLNVWVKNIIVLE